MIDKQSSRLITYTISAISYSAEKGYQGESFKVSADLEMNLKFIYSAL